jgi:hypothetical protein
VLEIPAKEDGRTPIGPTGRGEVNKRFEAMELNILAL